MKKYWGWVGLSLVSCLFFSVARQHILGGFSDEPMFILLAQSLWHGLFKLPMVKMPITDPLPGYPLLLALPVHLLGGHWNYYFLIGFFQTIVSLYFSWLLAREILTTEMSLAAFLLISINPVILFYSGAVFLDTAYLASSVILFYALYQAKEKSVLYWAPLAALSPLIKPHGVILVFCLMVLISLRFNWKKAILFGFVSCLPLALWFLRNHLVAGTSMGYINNWLSQASLTQNGENPFKHGEEIIASLWCGGLLGMSNRAWTFIPFWMSLSFGFIFIFLFSSGVVKLMKDLRRQPLVFSIALYVILVTLLHCLWPSLSIRYAIPLIPFLWIFIAAGLEGVEGGRTKKWALVLISLILIRSGAMDGPFMLRASKGKPFIMPDTLKWIREKTRPAARIATYDPAMVLLASQRYAITAVANDFDSWISLLVRGRFDYIVAISFYYPDGFTSKYDILTRSREDSWMRQSPYFKKVYSNPKEGTVIYHFSHPHPQRFLKAYHDFNEAKIAMILGYARRKNFVRKELKEAVRLEPTLAYAWAALGSIEASPRKRLYDFERAYQADPSSTEIAADLARLRAKSNRS